MSSEPLLYRIESDGSCSCYGTEAWGGQPLPPPPGDPFKHRWLNDAWVPIPIEELPVEELDVSVVSLEQQVAELKTQVAAIINGLGLE